LQPGQWVFPAGTTLAAAVTWLSGVKASPQRAFDNPGESQHGQSLDGNSGGVICQQCGAGVDYGSMVPDQQPIHRSHRWELGVWLARPDSPGWNAAAATLGAAASLRFTNGWGTSSGGRLVRAYNLDAQPVAPERNFLTDDPCWSARPVLPLPRCRSSPATAGDLGADWPPSHGSQPIVNFQLAGWGQSLRLYGRT